MMNRQSSLKFKSNESLKLTNFDTSSLSSEDTEQLNPGDEFTIIPDEHGTLAATTDHMFICRKGKKERLALDLRGVSKSMRFEIYEYLSTQAAG